MMMRDTVSVLLLATRKKFAHAGLEPAGIDARSLMQAATGLSHEQIVAEPDFRLSAEAIAKFSALVQRRLAEEPISRILGRREFYGREFQVSPAVLDPRGDTEALIELVLSLPMKQGRLLDMGTGSGAIVVTLLAELPNFTGLAVDVSLDALHVAKLNALSNGVSERLHFHHGSWFEKLSDQFDLIVSNPPYICHGDIAGLGREVKDYDPHLALDGGADGLFAYRVIAGGAARFLTAGGRVVVEIGAGQGPEVKDIFAASHFSFVAQKIDLGGHLRAIVFGL
jgi:release factor glutamine methyltransferase